MCCAADNHNYICHKCAKEFSDSNFNQAVIDKISNFLEIAPNSTYSQISKFFKYNCIFLDQLLHPYKFHGRDMSGILFFIFASCEPLTLFSLSRWNCVNLPLLAWLGITEYGGIKNNICMIKIIYSLQDHSKTSADDGCSTSESTPEVRKFL